MLNATRGARLGPRRLPRWDITDWALFSFAQGDTAAALVAWRGALAQPDVGPRHSAAYANVGDVFAARGKIDAAIQTYGQAVRLSSNDASVHVKLGWAFLRKRQLNEAGTEFREAIRI